MLECWSPDYVSNALNSGYMLICVQTVLLTRPCKALLYPHALFLKLRQWYNQTYKLPGCPGWFNMRHTYLTQINDSFWGTVAPTNCNVCTPHICMHLVSTKCNSCFDALLKQDLFEQLHVPNLSLSRSPGQGHKVSRSGCHFVSLFYNFLHFSGK